MHALILCLCVCVVIVRCQSLTSLSDGEVSISDGTHGVELGVGAVATYSCNPGYGLVGVATRMCVGTGIIGTWTGSPPTCQGQLLSCYINGE